MASRGYMNIKCSKDIGTGCCFGRGERNYGTGYAQARQERGRAGEGSREDSKAFSRFTILMRQDNQLLAGYRCPVSHPEQHRALITTSNNLCVSAGPSCLSGRRGNVGGAKASHDQIYPLLYRESGRWCQGRRGSSLWAGPPDAPPPLAERAVSNRISR